MKRPAKQRFTLIELLVVVAIISILASMLLPALSKARSKAKTITCLNKMKQFGLANAMYADEWDGMVVPHSVGKPGNPRYLKWNGNGQLKDLMEDKLWPYAYGTYKYGFELWERKSMCPVASWSHKESSSTINGKTYKGHWMQYSYGYNSSNIGWNDPYRGKRINFWLQPEMVVSFMDSTEWNAGYSRIDNWYSDEIAPGGSNKGQAFRHMDGMNGAFFDGHAETLKRAQARNVAHWKNQ